MGFQPNPSSPIPFSPSLTTVGVVAAAVLTIMFATRNRLKRDGHGNRDSAVLLASMPSYFHFVGLYPPPTWSVLQRLFFSRFDENHVSGRPRLTWTP
ncbi:hypothetical protein BDZ89DRAFT_1167702 [Hymenopellis radicata]|nr:hypothetical protein BDZ89DRAFT_1167702 [Hymenopellis radicata]